jgi:hypothetical protein
VSGVTPGLTEEGFVLVGHDAVYHEFVLNCGGMVVYQLGVDEASFGPLAEFLDHFGWRGVLESGLGTIPELGGMVGEDEGVVTVPFLFCNILTAGLEFIQVVW